MDPRPPLPGVFLVLPVTSSPQVVIRVVATEMIKHQPEEEEDEEGSKQCGGLWCHILLLLPLQSRTFVTWGQRQIQPVAARHNLCITLNSAAGGTSADKVGDTYRLKHAAPAVMTGGGLKRLEKSLNMNICWNLLICANLYVNNSKLCNDLFALFS